MVRTALRTFRTVSLEKCTLARENPMSVSIDKSTVHRVVHTLHSKLIAAHLYSSFHSNHFQST